MTVSVEIINQLNDNYSYLICSNENNSGIVIDPAESDKILEVLKMDKKMAKVLIQIKVMRSMMESGKKISHMVKVSRH